MNHVSCIAFIMCSQHIYWTGERCYSYSFSSRAHWRGIQLVHKKSKFYYNHLVEEKNLSRVSENYWINFTRLRITREDLLKSYVSKVKHIKDKKLAETNFKILNNILPCNRNLRKWGKSDTDLCCFCQEEEDISHLLYFCVHVKPIWEIVNNVILPGEFISHDMVTFGYETD